MARKTADWGFKVHRDALRVRLGLDKKLAPEYTARFENVVLPSDRITLDAVGCYNGNNPHNPDDRVPIPGLWTVLVKEAPANLRRKSSAHRVFIVCKCGKQIPAGRLHQHRGTCKI